LKVYITRDEGDDHVWLWKKPSKSNWKPERLKECETVMFVRHESMDELDSYDCYTVSDFETKFGIKVEVKTCESQELDDKLIKSNDFKMFSDDAERKK